jgi:hypothetical protein
VQVIGPVLGILVGAGIAAVILWMVKAPVRTARYVGREVRARDVRNRETLGLPSQMMKGSRAERLGDVAEQRRQTAAALRGEFTEDDLRAARTMLGQPENPKSY